MQTILGAGGAIGVELAKALLKYTKDIRLVNRHPEKVNPTDTLMTADLLDQDQLKKAVKGSEIVYVTVGFPYNAKVWQETWPAFMKNVIEACIAEKAKLVFFDNVYMYDPKSLNGMTEETPMNPTSEKGKVRAKLVKMIMENVATGKLNALIARAADFYGPGIDNTSMLNEMVFKPLSKGKRANWMASVDYKHSFTYTPDAGRATALLGNTPDAFNQVWHLPTAGNPPTGREWIEMIASEFGVKAKYQVAGKFIIKIMGWFVPIMKEMPEMLYQYDRDYVFNSDKFEKRFKVMPTPYSFGVETVVHTDYE
ncbi:NAD-dependent epimerase/dehydratase family protein [Saccharicrinis sp. FJH54]|uniref:NAD-dependent epimerase/dehydratase family protein n=1 Tax=Saccharicrinis sp. FJH54 TaxID=3344665 RepID=UPI0035D4CFFC